MIFKLILTMSLCFAGDSKEMEIISIFKKTSKIERKYSNDKKNREERDSYLEKKFEPAFDSMSKLLEEGKCKNCLGVYLNTISYFKNSEDEVYTDQLQKIILKESNTLNLECLKLDHSIKNNLKEAFKFSVLFLSKSNNVEIKKIEKSISNCLVSK